MTLQQGRQSMHLAAVVVLVVDCSQLLPRSSAEAPAGLSAPVSDGLGGSLPSALTRREVALAHDTLQEGRVLVVAANKLDVVPPKLRKQVGLHRAVAVAPLIHAQTAQGSLLPIQCGHCPCNSIWWSTLRCSTRWQTACRLWSTPSRGTCAHALCLCW